jgi:cell division transport system ATP-binding protein
MILLKHVYKTYDSDRHALRDISFTLNPSELIFLTGPSGAGKTTLFKLLSIQEKITSGQLNFNDYPMNDFNLKRMTDYRRKLGIVFQDFRLIADLNIFENIAVPLKIQNYSKKEVLLAVGEVLERFGLEEYAQSFPDYISGGEKQRVAIARAIVHKPELIIADEPTGNLDRKNALSVLNIFQDLAAQGVAVMVATHDEEFLKSTTNKSKVRQIHLERGHVVKDQSL